MGQIQIKAQVLRDWPEQDTLGPMGASPIKADPGAEGAGRWTEAEVKRAIACAEAAGLASYRIELAPDGTVSIVVGDPSPDGDHA